MNAYLADGLEPRITIVVGGEGGTRIDAAAVIDTGFSGLLTLPLAIIQSLGLRRAGLTEVRLADGSIRDVREYRGRVLWFGDWRSVLIQEAESDVLIGVSMLAGYQLCVEFVESGSVTIEEIG